MVLSSLLGIGEASPPVAPSGTVVTEQKLAEEIAPFYKDLLEKTQALYDLRTEEGYRPYEGPTMAERTPDELAAIEGIRALVGSQDEKFARADELLGGVADKFTAETAQEYMNPYQQAVTDVAKREAREDFEILRDKFEKTAVDAGGMSGLGSRAGVQAGLLGQANLQNLADIQTRGLASAFSDARAAFEAQKRREAGVAAELPKLAMAEYGATAKELAGLQAIGEDERARQQTALDERYKQFLEEERFPEQQLAQYQSVVQGFPNISSQVRTTSTPQPTGAQRFLSSAAGLGSLYGSFGGFTPQGFGSAWMPQGKKATGGLVGLPVTKAFSGGVPGLSNLGDRFRNLFREEVSPLQPWLVGSGVPQQRPTGGWGTKDPEYTKYMQDQAARRLQDENKRFYEEIEKGYIEPGTGGIGEGMLTAAYPPQERPDVADKSVTERLYEATLAKHAAEKKALEEAKESKTTRSAEAAENARQRDMINTLSRFSKAILDPGATIGSAAGVAILEGDPARQEEAKRQSKVSDKLDEINAKIAIAKETGDLQALTKLFETKTKLEELSIKRGDLKLKRAKAKLENYFKTQKLGVERTKTLSDILEKIVMDGISNESAIVPQLVNQVFANDSSVSQEMKDNFAKAILSAVNSAGINKKKNPRTPIRSRVETANQS